MIDFYSLEMQARELVERYRAEAEHDRLVREAKEAAQHRHGPATLT